MSTNHTEGNSLSDYDSDNRGIFEGVIFELDPNISSSEQSKLKEQLLNHGAECYNDKKSKLEHPTHYITYLVKSANAAHSVTPLWIQAAIRNGFTHDPKYYSPDPSNIFSGMVVAASGIPDCDQEAIFGATMAFGGQYREKLASDVTHLICIVPEGSMYNEAMGPLHGKVKVVLPHWFDECFRLRRLIPDGIYRFPAPSFLSQRSSSNEIDESAVSASNEQPVSTNQSTTNLGTDETTGLITTSSKHKDNTQHDNMVSANYGHNRYAVPKNDILKNLVPKERLFEGKLIYIHSDIGLPPDTHTCLVQHLETAGGTVTNNYDDTKDDKSVIAIFKYRNSDVFYKACKSPTVLVANLAWITNTLIRGRLESPFSSIYYYPVPYGGIVGMQNMTTTISGYEGGARNLLFQLCSMVGLSCSVNFDNSTTHIICSKRGSAKYKAGRKRNCHIVNHLWLEDCFQQWEVKSVADSKYTHFPSNNDNALQDIVGDAPLQTRYLELWWNKDTCPVLAPYTPMYMLHRSPTSGNSPTESTGSARRPRQAALDANTQLRDVFIPDMNDYQKGHRTSTNQQHLTTSTTTVSTDKTNSYTSDSSAPASKRAKLENMESKSPSLEPSPQAHSVKAPPHQPSTSQSRHRTSKENEQTDISAEDEEMEDSTLPIDSKQDPTTSSSFVFADSPSKIATTSCELTKDDEKGIRRLGSALVDDMRKADVLVVPDRILRTPKFLCAVNLGTTIVGLQWLKDSIANEAWCHPSEYQVKDSAMEKAHGFNLSESLLTAQMAKQNRNGGWLHGYEICVLPSAGSPQSLKEVVETAGGIVVPVPKRRSQGNSQTNTDRTNTLLALADKKDKKQKGWNDLMELGIKVYDKEMIIVGALQQHLALDRFCLV